MLGFELVKFDESSLICRYLDQSCFLWSSRSQLVTYGLSPMPLIVITFIYPSSLIAT